MQITCAFSGHKASILRRNTSGVFVRKRKVSIFVLSGILGRRAYIRKVFSHSPYKEI